MNPDLVQALRKVDGSVLAAAARMCDRLLTVPDLQAGYELDPAEFGIDENSAEWDVFMQVVDRFDVEAGACRDVIADHLAEFTDAVNTVLAESRR